MLNSEELRMIAHERAGECIKLRAEIEALRHDLTRSAEPFYDGQLGRVR